LAHPTLPSADIVLAAIHSLLSHPREHRASPATRKASPATAQQPVHGLTVAELPERLRASMKKFLSLLFCFLLSIFAVVRATKPAHMPAPGAKAAQNDPRGQPADAKTLLYDANTGDEVTSDGDDSTEPPSSDDGEDVNDDGGGDAPADEDTGDDHAGDGDEGNDDGGDEGE